jgi:DNA modification methylase/transcriptional regulator with XRE-family HTH domain
MSYLFGARLQELREREGLTLRDLATELGVDHTYLSHIESGRRTPRDDFLQRVADRFKQDVDVLRIQAGQVPEHVLTLMQRNPQVALTLLESSVQTGAVPAGAWRVSAEALIEHHSNGGQIEFPDQYTRAPFAQPVGAGKNTAVYNAHSYHTKVPYQGIIPYLEHYTSPGDLILDPFCGSGMTGVAAILSGRNAVLNDLSPAAVHIARNYTTPCDPRELERAYHELVADVSSVAAELYMTKCDACGGPAVIEYSIFTDVFACGGCDAEVTPWHHGRDQSGKLTGHLDCPACGMRQDKNDLRWLRSVPCLVNYTCLKPCSRRRQERAPSDNDLGRLDRISAVEPAGWVPDREFGPGWEMWRQGHHDRGIHTVRDFFTPRNLHALSVLHERIRSRGDTRVAAALLFGFTGCVNRASKRYQWNHQRPTNVLSGTLYVSSLFYEFNVFRLFERKVRASLRLFGMMQRAKGTAAVTCGSATSLKMIPDASIDYVFTDPPFGSNIYYSDCSLLWEAWLDAYTDRPEEIVVSRSRKPSDGGKDLEMYQALLTQSLREIRRVLKPNRWASVVFHNSSAEVWEAVRTACIEAGFSLGGAAMFDKKQKSFKGIKGIQVGERVANFDVVLNLQKTQPVLFDTESKVASEMRIVESLRSLLATSSKDDVERGSTAYLHSHAVRQAWNEKLDLSTIDLKRFEALLDREFIRCESGWCLRDRLQNEFAPEPEPYASGSRYAK